MKLKDPKVSILFIIVGCCLNNILLEYKLKQEKGSGNLITFFHFLFITMLRLPNTIKRNLKGKKRKLQIKHYLPLVASYFLISILSNIAYSFDIPYPFHLLFRSISLIINTFLNYLIRKRKQNIKTIFSVICVSVGIFIATYSTYSSQILINKENNIYDQKSQNNQEMNYCNQIYSNSKSNSNSNSDRNSDSYLSQKSSNFVCHLKKLINSFKPKSGSNFIIGITLLLFSIVISNLLGLYQDWLNESYRSNWKENLFWNHFLSLPFFFFFKNDIIKQSIQYSNSKPIGVSFLNQILHQIKMPTQIPILWLFLFINGLTQYICIIGVYSLVTATNSLMVTFVITLRKFISLVISIFLFKNNFNLAHWIAAFLVFGGTIFFNLGKKKSKVTSEQLNENKKEKEANINNKMKPNRKMRKEFKTSKK
ncbi:udp-xylose and udp-n-acetylglucosamine transporter [Anaeramoeba flamelloides]|uniref:Udp-xylose and udp-n-acetylglucosamine transporter n=1 Tax=Anaeramoeba flamelloides TaxID=1746091 RepID=A0AAV7Y8E1_9EUKA|nr:udp-xylose and udp-n-acetylglucosamine transporter [Anaeramoeba flamelloides]